MASDDPHRVPIGVERALQRAAQDREFFEALQARGAEAARQAGIELTATEARLLDTIGPERIARMVERLPPAVVEPVVAQPVFAAQGIRPDADPTRGIRPELLSPAGIRPEPSIVRGTRPGVKIAVAAGAVLTTGVVGTGLLLIAGSRPDEPPPPAEPESTSEGEAKSAPDAGAEGGNDPAPESS